MPYRRNSARIQNANVLVAAATQTSYTTISSIIQGAFPRVSQAASMTVARQMIARDNVDHLIINAPMPDEFGLQSALDIAARNRQISVLMLIKSDIYSQASMQTRGTGIYLLTKPLKGQVLLETLQNMENARLRVEALAADNRKLKARLDDMGLITRAKCLLIEKEQMTEEAAHRYLETNAMNQGRTVIEIAREVVRRLAEGEE